MKMINTSSRPYRVFTVRTPRGTVETGSLNELRRIINERLKEGVEKKDIRITKTEGAISTFEVR